MDYIDSKLSTYRQYIQMLGKNLVTSIVFKSKGGLGKSHNTIRILKEEKIEYAYITGHTTPLELYKLMYNNNGKVIIIDDIEEVFSDKKSISLLKSALWDVDKQRNISYMTTTDMGNIPTSFNFTGGIILLVNKLKPKMDDSFKALISRTLLYELNISLKDFYYMSYEIMYKTNKLNEIDKRFALDILLKHINRKNINLNFRLIDKLISFVSFDKERAETLFLNTIQ